MRKFVVFLLKCYRYLVSPFLGNNCRFYPSCSSYAETAILRFGLLKGFWLALKRLAKCHPWHAGGLDEVPDTKNKTTDLNPSFQHCPNHTDS